MKTVYFKTQEEIDPRSWSVMGLNAKPNSNNPIGYFGTGMKMAIAVILRNKGTITITSLGKKYRFTTESANFRGTEYQQILCNRVPLAYTTELAKNWEMWMAYRELYCNTNDECGSVSIGMPPVSLYELGTVIEVWNDEFFDCHINRAEYFLCNRTPIASTDKLEIYEGKGTIFYRGIRVGVFPATQWGQTSEFDYNILSFVALTEDRTIKWPFQIEQLITEQVIGLEDESLVTRFVTPPQNSKERSLSYSDTWTDFFTEIVIKLWRTCPTKVIPSLALALKTKKPDVGFTFEEMTVEQKRMVDRAIEFLAKAGIKISCPIKIVKNSDTSNIAFYNNGTIYLTERSFDSGTHELIATLIEENCHHLGYHDESREFERYLMKEIINQANKYIGWDL